MKDNKILLKKNYNNKFYKQESTEYPFFTCAQHALMWYSASISMLKCLMLPEPIPLICKNICGRTRYIPVLEEVSWDYHGYHQPSHMFREEKDNRSENTNAWLAKRDHQYQLVGSFMSARGQYSLFGMDSYWCESKLLLVISIIYSQLVISLWFSYAAQTQLHTSVYIKYCNR